MTTTTTTTNRYALQLLAPAAILASIAGRKQIEMEDISEMGELFLDAKSSAEAIGSFGAAGAGAGAADDEGKEEGKTL